MFCTPFGGCIAKPGRASYSCPEGVDRTDEAPERRKLPGQVRHSLDSRSAMGGCFHFRVFEGLILSPFGMTEKSSDFGCLAGGRLLLCRASLRTRSCSPERHPMVTGLGFMPLADCARFSLITRSALLYRGIRPGPFETGGISSTVQQGLCEAGAVGVGGDLGVDFEGEGEGGPAGLGGDAGLGAGADGVEEVFELEAEGFGVLGV